MVGLVSFDLCEGNPGALTFMLEAYKYRPFAAECAFARMRDAGITGSKLYMLWNDCCSRDTQKAVGIMRKHEIDDILKHINYGEGRGIPYGEID